MSKDFRKILVLVETSNEYGRDILRGVMRYVREAPEKHRIPWRVSFEYRGPVDEFPVDFVSWHGDGILSRCFYPYMYTQLVKKKVPVVELLNNGITNEAIIQTDEPLAAKMAFTHFYERGLREFAFYAIGNSWWIQLRRNAFCEQVEQHGLKCYVNHENDIQQDNSVYPRWEERFRQSLMNWLKTLPKPIGIWCAMDLFALRVLHACQELGYNVPNEVAILGSSNDSLLCSLQTPSLSSVDLNAELMGYVAAEYLDKQIDVFHETGKTGNLTRRNKSFTPVLIPPLDVVTRQSTDMMAVTDRDCVEALQYIRENFTKSIRPQDVADHVAMSRTTLDRRFIQFFGRSIDREIFRLKMELAETLLLQTDLPINVIFKRVGYSSYEYFFRAFKRMHSITPQTYRDQRG